VTAGPPSVVPTAPKHRTNQRQVRWSFAPQDPPAESIPRRSYDHDVLTVLCGGVGAARLLVGLSKVVDPCEITAVVNVGDDLVLHGLHISPDLDTVTYTLAGLNNDVTGWGIVDESWRVMDELSSLGGDTWFGLGDRDLATHLYRTGRLAAGATLSEVAAEIASARGVSVTVRPVTDDRVATELTTVDGERLSFQEYFVARRHEVAIRSIVFDGAAAAAPAPGVLESIAGASKVVIAPSNPLLSIDPVLAVPGIAEAIRRRRLDAIAISPLVGGAALKGPADRLMRELGHDPDALGVARHYRGLVGTMVIDEADEALSSQIEALGMRCIVTDTVMADIDKATSLASSVLAA
jgi:LPPG:FO 2-phospho-L-lactate transferase